MYINMYKYIYIYTHTHIYMISALQCSLAAVNHKIVV